MISESILLWTNVSIYPSETVSIYVSAIADMAEWRVKQQLKREKLISPTEFKAAANE